MKILGKIACILALILSLTPFSINAQENTLDLNFKEYEIATFDSHSLRAEAYTKRNDFIQLPFILGKNHKWNLELTTEKVFSDDFVRREGKSAHSRSSLKLPITMTGYGQNSNHTRAVITVNDNFLYGRVETLEEVIYFEPLSTFDPNAAPNQIVIYKESDIIEREHGTCAAHESKAQTEKLKLNPITSKSNLRSAPACKQVDLVIANDHTMKNHYGSNSAVTNFNAGVMANVNSDYDNDFSDVISFVIVETYIAQNSGDNDWGATSNIGDLLDNFSAWAGSGFSTPHDLGQLWSRTDLIYHNSNGSTNSSTIGLAWVDVVCNNGYKYHVLEDYGGNANGLRNLVSHEIGHNFNRGSHTSSSGYIMSSSVSGATAWHSSSVNLINSGIATYGCLGACTGNPPGGGGSAPDADFDASYISECNPTRLQFNDLSSNDPTTWAWQFEDGSPSSSSQQNPQVDFPGAGSYGVTLTATNEHGSNTQIYNMNLSNIGNPPNTDFNFSTSGYIASFVNTTTNATSYDWDFGDGSSSTSTNPSHTYASTGSYNVTLTASNDCGSSTDVQTVTITDQVTAAFTSNTTEVCEGQSISFTNQSSSNVETFYWQFENGTPSTSTEENPTVTYNNAGTFNVRLTVTGGGTDDTENKVNYVSIEDEPNTNFSFIVDGYTVEFDNNTVGGSNFNWSFGDGATSVVAHPNHTYASSGTYSVTLTSSNACGTNEHVEEITIADEVNAEFTVNENDGCAEFEYEFTNESTGNITSYYWEFEDGIPSTSTEENPTVTFDSPGWKDVRLTVSNSLYSDQEIKNNYIEIDGPPEVHFDFVVTDFTVEFDNNTVGGSSFDWDFGDGFSSIQAHPVHTYSSPGDYEVTLTSSNDCFTEEYSVIVSIESDIVARFTGAPQEICPGEVVNFTNTSDGDITSYFWEFEGGNPATSTEENPSVIFNNAGSYNVKLTVSDGSNSDDDNKSNYIEVSSDPIASFEIDADEYTIDLTNTSLHATNYEWDFGDGNSSVSSNPSHTYSAPGTYTIRLISTNDCGEDEEEQIVEIEEILEANWVSNLTGTCEGGSVSFDNASIGDISSILWEFEGGSPASSTEENPTISYATAGTFDVKLTVTSNHGGTDSKTLTEYITVESSPVADFNYSLSKLTIELTNNSEHYNTVSWNFGDGNTSTDINPTHTFAQEGNYVVTLSVSGECGEDVKELEIPVFDELLANFMATETTLCPGQEITLVDLSSGNPTEWEWIIEGQEMINIEEQNPTIVLDQAGTYNVQLTVRNQDEEDSKIVQQYIEVMALPAAQFDFVQEELSVSFSNNSENGKSFYWDFGDGNTSEEANPSHVYTEEGNYIVMLRVTNDCNTEEVEQEIAVFNRLVAGFAAQETDICTGTQIQFQDQSSGNAVSWNWSFPGGTPTTSNEKNPIVTYETAGNYDVILTVLSDTEELTIEESRLISVSEAASAAFEYEVNKNVVSFTSTVEHAEELLWSFGSTESNPVYEFEEEKAYEVSLLVSNACSEEEVTKTIDLYAEAETYANFSIGSSAYCLGDEIAFVNLSSDDVTEYSWKFPGGIPEESSEENPIVTYSDFGVYDVELTVSNGFNVRTVKFEDYVAILDQPQAGFDIIQTNNTIQVVNTAESYSSLTWFINGEMQMDFDDSFSFEKNGKYIIKQIASNACSQTEFADTISIDVFPTAGFSVDETTGCAPFTVNFESRSTDNTSEVVWLFQGAETEEGSGMNPSATYYEPGVYGVTVIATNEFGSDTINLTNVIEVLDTPEVSFDYTIDGNSVEFFADVEDYDKIIWDFDDGFTGGDVEVVHNYLQEGTYTVTLTVYLGNCISTYTEEVVLLSSGVEDIEEFSKFNVYPNPASAAFTISVEGISNAEYVTIFNQLGEKVWSKSIEGFTDEVVVQSIEQFAAGPYLVALKVEGRSPIYRKLLILR